MPPSKIFISLTSHPTSPPLTGRLVNSAYLKSKKNPSDIDISLELLDISTQLDRMDISIDHRHEWQNYLSEKLGMKVDLQFYDKNMKNMPKYLAEASLLLYDSSEKAD